MNRNTLRVLLLVMLAALLFIPSALAASMRDFLGTWECISIVIPEEMSVDPRDYGASIIFEFNTDRTCVMTSNNEYTPPLPWYVSGNVAIIENYTTATLKDDLMYVDIDEGYTILICQRISSPIPICTHPEDQIITWDVVSDSKYEAIDSSTHKVSGKLSLGRYCQVCETYLDVLPSQENYVANESHHFKNGTCEQCGYNSNAIIKPTKIFLYDEGTLILNMGETVTLPFYFTPVDAFSDVKWSSSSKKIATVDKNGVVTPIKEGTATITVKTSNNKKDTVKIKVVDPYKPSKIVLDVSGTVTLNLGESLQVNATLQPDTAKTTLNWSSSSKKIAKVDENGVVTPVKEGSATITVKTANGKKDTVKIKVVDPFKATGIKAISSKLTVTEGDIFAPEYVLTPATATSTVKVTTSNKKVLKINADGTVAALKKGSATLTLKTATGKSCKIKVTVLTKATTPEETLRSE